jgi:hypothetical protein
MSRSWLERIEDKIVAQRQSELPPTLNDVSPATQQEYADWEASLQSPDPLAAEVERCLQAVLRTLGHVPGNPPTGTGRLYLTEDGYINGLSLQDAVTVWLALEQAVEEDVAC